MFIDHSYKIMFIDHIDMRHLILWINSINCPTCRNGGVLNPLLRLLKRRSEGAGSADDSWLKA